MKSVLLLAASVLSARAANIVLSNDDGWAEINIRTLFNILQAAGENVVLSSPAENESGTGRFKFRPIHSIEV
jgi:broad specificity polyphosphatase/5'/3'-nucleotidase SurE